MSVMCCPLSGCDDDGSTGFTSQVKAAKEHRCCECAEVITKSQKHEMCKLLFDGRWSTYRTCLSCVEIRNHFACDGWTFENVWNDLEENFFPDMKAGGPCMEGLSPAAKDRLFARRLAWLERT